MSFLTSRESRAPQGIGKSIPRREDARPLTGAGQYADDFSLPSQAYMYRAIMRARGFAEYDRARSIFDRHRRGPATDIPGNATDYPAFRRGVP
jgi:hypothetical protein